MCSGLYHLSCKISSCASTFSHLMSSLIPEPAVDDLDPSGTSFSVQLLPRLPVHPKH